MKRCRHSSSTPRSASVTTTPGAGRRHAHDVVVEPAAAGHLDVGQRQAHPVAVVHAPFAVYVPLHAVISSRRQ